MILGIPRSAQARESVPAPGIRSKLAFLSRKYVSHPLCGAVLFIYAFVATVIETVPVTFVLSLLIALKKSRWKEFLILSVLGSSFGALLLAWLSHLWGYSLIASYYPGLVSSESWKAIEIWVARYGMWGVAGIAAVPLPLTPAIALCGLMRMPLFSLFVAVLIGKTIKYSVTAIIAHKAATQVKWSQKDA